MGCTNLESFENKSHLPGDSSRDLFIPKRWRSLNYLTIQKGHLTNHPKKGTIAELPSSRFFKSELNFSPTWWPFWRADFGDLQVWEIQAGDGHGLKKLARDILGGGFKFFILTPTWGNDPFWLIFFR